jgi:hypothetical protein
MRNRRPFERPEGKKSARLVIIASEGRFTESIYFDAVKAELCASNVHMEVLRRETDNSSPDYVHEQLREFMREYEIDDDDELWMVIDRDRWQEGSLSQLAQLCDQNQHLRFCMSNPCFELWLLLHLEDISTYDDKQLKELQENRKTAKFSDTWLKRRVRALLGSYSESDYDAYRFMPLVDTACRRAKELDINPSDRWPQTIGTRVYRLIESIRNSK